MYVRALQPVECCYCIALCQRGHAPRADRCADQLQRMSRRQPFAVQQAVESQQAETFRSSCRGRDARDVSRLDTALHQQRTRTSPRAYHERSVIARRASCHVRCASCSVAGVLGFVKANFRAFPPFCVFVGRTASLVERCHGGT
jgi:hypothetical protein